jgi:hypothetical protein
VPCLLVLLISLDDVVGMVKENKKVEEMWGGGVDVESLAKET